MLIMSRIMLSEKKNDFTYFVKTNAFTKKIREKKNSVYLEKVTKKLEGKLKSFKYFQNSLYSILSPSIQEWTK